VDASGRLIPVTVHYDDVHRTAIVTVLGPPPVRAALVVATPLTDINGQHLAGEYRYGIRG
jgi:hypothetical protein